MKVSMVGCGKLGLPVAVAMDWLRHDVVGFDMNQARMSKLPEQYKEAGPRGTGDFNEWLKTSNVRFGSLAYAVEHGEIVFVAVQTPHDRLYEGITRLPNTRLDFDYSYLVGAIEQIADVCETPTVLAIISTVLPGTVQRLIEPIVARNPHLSLTYNPSFIAMGTTMRDFLWPEFVLIGGNDKKATDLVASFYRQITDAPQAIMSIPSAELAKVAYNTMIGLKITWANTIMEICDGIPDADCDQVHRGLSLAHRRLWSPLYTRGGMGDGGGCHPRDNIALSALARERPLSCDLFEAAMLCRERQAEWLASMAIDLAQPKQLPITVLGIAFKPESNLIVGSPALLVEAIIKERYRSVMVADDDVREHGDPYERDILANPSVVIIGCRHERYRSVKFAPGTIVIDPHRYIPDGVDVEVIRLGSAARGI